MPAQLIMSTHVTMIAAADELSSESANATPGIVFSNLPIGIYRATSTGRIVAANKTLLQMFDSNSLKELNDTFEAPGFHLVCQRKEFQEQLKTVGVIRAFESSSSLHDGRSFHSRENVNENCVHRAATNSTQRLE